LLRRVHVSLSHQPAYAKATVQLAPGESIKAEAGALMTMLGDVQVQTSSGGILKGLKRSILGGESFFQNTFTAGPRGGTVELVPPLPGDIKHLSLWGGLIVQDSSYLASAATVQVDTRWQGFRGFFASEGFVMLHVTGQGDLLLSSYGAIDERVLAPGEVFRVDTGHLVAFSDHMRFENRPIGGVKSTLLSGEGILSEFTGPGTVYTQSRSSLSFLNWLARRLPGGGGSQGGSGGLFGT
jgi:uncharacterized protein (TIGR00266 family)